MKIFQQNYGSIGYMKELTRTKINKFTLENSITVEELKNRPEMACKLIISVEDLFKDNEKINLNDRKKELFLNGVKLTFEKSDGIYRIYNNNQFIGLGIIKENLLKRDIVVL